MNQLQYFKAVAETGKVSEAAKQLQVTGPAVSIAISKLESELNVTLFSRIGNRLIITRQGQVFLEYVERILFGIDCAAEEVKLMSKKVG